MKRARKSIQKAGETPNPNKIQGTLIFRYKEFTLELNHRLDPPNKAITPIHFILRTKPGVNLLSMPQIKMIKNTVSYLIYDAHNNGIASRVLNEVRKKYDRNDARLQEYENKFNNDVFDYNDVSDLKTNNTNKIHPAVKIYFNPKNPNIMHVITPRLFYIVKGIFKTQDTLSICGLTDVELFIQQCFVPANRCETSTDTSSNANINSRPTSPDESYEKFLGGKSKNETVRYKGRQYSVHFGPRGGKYIKIEREMVSLNKLKLDH